MGIMRSNIPHLISAHSEIMQAGQWDPTYLIQLLSIGRTAYMARASSNRCVYVDILDDEGNVIGVAHASGYINNDKFVDLLKELNELTEYDGDVRYFNPDDLEY